jgi:hypothetical protein
MAFVLLVGSDEIRTGGQRIEAFLPIYNVSIAALFFNLIVLHLN